MNCIYARKTDKWRLYGIGEPRECCSKEEAEFLMSAYGSQTAAEASCGRHRLLLPKNTPFTLAVELWPGMWRVMYPPYVFPGEWKLRKDAMNWIRDTFGNIDKIETVTANFAYVTVGKAEKTPRMSAP